MYSKVKDFLTDDDFINYVLGVVPQSVSKWEAYFKEHPDELADAEEDVACDFTMAESKELKDRIVSSIKDFSGIL